MENKKKRQDIAVMQRERGREREFCDQVKRFEGFILENEAKEERTDEKFFEELKLKEEDVKEFEKLKQQYTEIIPKLGDMEEKVDKYSICESYLLQIASLLPPDYIKMADDAPMGIIMRYNTLADTYRSLLDEMKAKSAQIRDLNSQLQSLREEHANRVLTVNSRLADLYKEHAINDEIVQQSNQNFYQDIKQIRNGMELFGTVIRSIYNLVGKCRWPYTWNSKEEDTLSVKLNRIEEYINTMRMILAELNENEDEWGIKNPTPFTTTDKEVDVTRQ
ncbi:unnamed protein product [Rodentolepis nana]|uniref:DUF4200 domain-containing protein n=1 Tax=Rodentolepis nana TaxID=102285 RepID=A0A0R3TLP7_RODNA|nr:unnamed protein product [Rodentolepis nana]